MATLVLTAAGSLLGPVGSAVGALIGQGIDARIFKPKGREGPRLQDLRLQTSSYGAAIPKLFGTMRVAGTVIWATDLVEHRAKQSGGKGRPSTTTYSYSASFAVLLSARAVRSIGRIWADGNLLRGAVGDWKAETGFRQHLGDEDQAEDPFIASAEGADGTPAYRGCAYAVFENMALASFGNRIPSLTFEIEADPGPVPLAAMLTELSGGSVNGPTGQALHGFAARSATLRDLVDELRAALPVDLHADGRALRIVGNDAPVVALGAPELSEDSSEELPGAARLLQALELGYYDPARDYQAGVQSARRPSGRGTERIELAAALDTSAARAIAEDALARLHREQGKRSVGCGWSRLAVAPGTIVSLPERTDTWRVAGRSVGRDGVRLDLRRVRFGAGATGTSDPGRSLPAADRVHGPTVVHLLDLPSLTPDPAGTPRLHVAAAGPSPGWRRAGLMASLDGGASWNAIGTTAPAAIIGHAVSVLATASEAVFDMANIVDVELLHGEMLLEDATRDRLHGGANLALLGDELIQFGRAAPLGFGVWRLSELVRGRRGTGWAAASHALGERFVMVEADSLFVYEPPLSAIGGAVRLLASGIGDTSPAETGAAAIGEALRPPPPVHFSAARRPDGGFDLAWIRSSRAGWDWLDGFDAPLAESAEQYRLSITRADGAARNYELTDSHFLYAAPDVAADSVAGGTVTLGVIQIGSRATSRATVLSLTL